MNIIELDNQKKDLMTAGFAQLDDSLLERRPPKINWGGIYKQKGAVEKIKYLENLASTMNHAAHLIQGERNQLVALCELKEGQISQLKKAMDQNMLMLQTEVTKINEERQLYNAHITELGAKIKELSA